MLRGRQEWNASEIRNVNTRMSTFLTAGEGVQSQRGVKRKQLLWKFSCISGRPQMYLECSKYAEAARSSLIRRPGIEAVGNRCSD